jgi:hypothetical protein
MRNIEQKREGKPQIIQNKILDAKITQKRNRSLSYFSLAAQCVHMHNNLKANKRTIINPANIPD